MPGYLRLVRPWLSPRDRFPDNHLHVIYGESYTQLQIGVTNYAETFCANCLIHQIAFITCCHPLVTLKSRLDSEEQLYILDHVTGLTAINISSITPEAREVA